MSIAKRQAATSGCFPKIVAAVDVQNPLLGENGATRVFGPQKGATDDKIDILERALAKLADVVSKEFGVDYRDEPGAGAAGGLGFGLMSFCGAKIRPGFEVVAEAADLESKMKECRSCDYRRREPGSADARGKNACWHSAARTKTWEARFRSCRTHRWKSTSARVVRWRLCSRATGNERERKNEASNGVTAGEGARTRENSIAAACDRHYRCVSQGDFFAFLGSSAGFK